MEIIKEFEFFPQHHAILSEENGEFSIVVDSERTNAIALMQFTDRSIAEKKFNELLEWFLAPTGAQQKDK